MDALVKYASLLLRREKESLSIEEGGLFSSSRISSNSGVVLEKVVQLQSITN